MTTKEKFELVLALRKTNHHKYFKAAQKGDKAARERLEMVVDAINAGDAQRAIDLCK